MTDSERRMDALLSDYFRREEPILVPCPTCDGSAVSTRAVWVYEHGCAFGHWDTEEDPCPECEGAGQTLVDADPITLEDLEEMAG